MAVILRRWRFARPTAIGSAAPGRRGGVCGLAALRTLLEHLHAPVLDTHIAVPTAHEVLGETALADPRTRDALNAIVVSVIRESTSVAV